MEQESKNKNSNYQRIDKAILSAFLSLSSKKQTDQITITELCTEANVNRTTFYNHYRGTWEIKEHISNELVEVAKRIMAEYKDKEFIANSLEILRAFNREIESRLDFYVAIHRMKESNSFAEKMISAFKENLTKYSLNGEIDTRYLETAFAYFAGGIFGAYKGWLSGRVTCSLDELAITLSQFIKNSFGVK